MSRLARVAAVGIERIRTFFGWTKAEAQASGIEWDEDLYMRLIEDR